MPDRSSLLAGADEDPSFAPPEPEPESTGPVTLEGLLPAVPGDGMASARLLRNWLRSGRLAGRPYSGELTKVWGALRRSPGAMEVARAQGYLAFACKTHGMIHCVECACPRCGAPGGCSCNARSMGRYTGGPKLVRPLEGVRRTGHELETMVADPTTIQRVLEQYPHGYPDGSLGADGWYEGIEFKMSTYGGTETGRARLANIVDRIHGVGGVGAPRCCGYHVHVEAMPDDSSNSLAGRWYEQQDDLYELFPTRRSNSYCERIGAPEGAYLRGHYTVLNRTGKGTWEVRLHPGTVSWIVAAAWGAWCHGFVSGSGSRLGTAYRDARRAALAVTGGRNAHPWTWRLAIERWHAANGRDHRRTLAEIAAGRFARYQDAEALRAATPPRAAEEV